MARGGCRPETKTIVVLGRKDYHAKARFVQYSYPLPSIQLHRVEECRIFFPITPLTVGKSIDAEVQKCRQLHLLPSQLL